MSPIQSLDRLLKAITSKNPRPLAWSGEPAQNHEMYAAIDAARTTLARFPTDGWKPIEICPLETWVLLWFVTVPLGKIKAPDAVVMGQRSAFEAGKFWDGHIYRPMEWVTHWMELPAGPKS